MSNQKIDYDAVIAELRKPDGWFKDQGFGAIREREGAVCLLGAVARTADHLGFACTTGAAAFGPVVAEHFADRIGVLIQPRDFDAVVLFNDHEDTTLDDVILVVEKARANQP